jgi:hypothetical protein
MVQDPLTLSRNTLDVLTEHIQDRAMAYACLQNDIVIGSNCYVCELSHTSNHRFIWRAKGTTKWKVRDKDTS